MSIAALLQAAEYIERRERGKFAPCARNLYVWVRGEGGYMLFVSLTMSGRAM